jgi:ATP-dependent protease ClpP protease subunit
MSKKSWYSIQAKAEDKPVDMSIYDEIGMWGITAKQFITDFKAATASNPDVELSINSPGGNVFDALAIHNVLGRYEGNLTVRIDGVAASAASLIAMAGKKIVMPENAFMMIHNAATIAWGEPSDLRKAADDLDKINDGIVAAYRKKTGMEDAELKKLMDAETWMNGLDAVAMGFADEMEEPVKIAASAHAAEMVQRFKAPPQALVAALEPEEPPPVAPEPEPEPKPAPVEPAPAMSAADLVKFTVSECQTAKLSAELATAVLHTSAMTNAETIKADVSAAAEIAGLCLAAGVPDTAATHIRAGLGVEQVRARLLASRADIEDINNRQPGGPSGAERPKPTLPCPIDIYQQRAKAARR